MQLVRLIIATLAGLADLGLPPGLDDQAALRAWLRKLLGLLQQLATITGTTADDESLRVLALAVENDDIWALLYGLIVRTDLAPADVTMAAGDDQVVQLACQAAVDPLTILAIISAVVDLLREWRKRKSA